MERQLNKELLFDGTVYKGELGDIVPRLKCLQCGCNFKYDPNYPNCPFCEGNEKYEETGEEIQVFFSPSRNRMKYRYFERDGKIYAIPQGHIRNEIPSCSFLGDIEKYVEIPKPHFLTVASYEEHCGTCGYHYYGIFKDEKGVLWELFEDCHEGHKYVRAFKPFGSRWKTVEEAVNTWKEWEEEQSGMLIQKFSPEI
jgi:hypothetical protein